MRRDPLLRSMLSWGLTDLTTWEDGDSLVWSGHAPYAGEDWSIGAVGQSAAGLLDSVAAELPVDAHLSVPRGISLGAVQHASYTEWELRWTYNVPPPASPTVDFLPGHAAEINPLLDSAYPSTEARPGDTDVRRWAVIRDDGTLVACAADASMGDTGRMSGIAVAPSARGRGLGVAVTVGLTRALLEEFDLVVLGLYVDNEAARRTYQRAGLTESLVVGSGPVASIGASAYGR